MTPEPTRRPANVARAKCAVLLAVSGALVMGACGANEGAVPTGRVHLRVATAPWLAYAPLHVAMAEGYFADEGLDVELVRMMGTEIAAPLLVHGDIDVLPGNLAPAVLNAAARGVPIRIVGKVQDPTTSGCSSIALLTRPGLLGAVREGRSPLIVKRISLNRQAGMLYLAHAALAGAGIDLDTLDIVDLPNASEAEALGSGAVDAALTGEPFLTRTVAAGQGERWLPLIDAVPGVEVSVLFFGPRLVVDDRESGVRFLAAYMRALRQLAEGKTPRNLARIAEATGDDPDLLRQACLPFGPTDGKVRMASVMQFQSWAVARGLLDRVVPEEDLWDPAFLDQALPPQTPP